MTTTQDQNTPTNTLEEKVRDIIFEYGSTNKSVNLGEAKSLIMELISEAVNKARIEELERLKKLHTRLSRRIVTGSNGEIYFDSSDLYISEYEVRERIAELNRDETPKQVEETE